MVVLLVIEKYEAHQVVRVVVALGNATDQSATKIGVHGSTQNLMGNSGRVLKSLKRWHETSLADLTPELSRPA